MNQHTRFNPIASTHINPFRKDAINVEVGNDWPQLIAYILGLLQFIAHRKRTNITVQKFFFSEVIQNFFDNFKIF